VLDRTRSWRVDHEVVSIVSILANPAVYGSNPAVFMIFFLEKGNKVLTFASIVATVFIALF
jgi:hypothetical protein